MFPAYRERSRRQEWSFSNRNLLDKAGRLVSAAKIRAKHLDLPFDLTNEWAAERLHAGVCEITGIAFELHYGFRGQFSPSIDRCEPSLGYTEQNSRLVVWIYNAAKGIGTHEDVLRLARSLVQPDEGASLLPFLPINAAGPQYEVPFRP